MKKKILGMITLAMITGLLVAGTANAYSVDTAKGAANAYNVDTAKATAETQVKVAIASQATIKREAITTEKVKTTRSSVSESRHTTTIALNSSQSIEKAYMTGAETVYRL